MAVAGTPAAAVEATTSSRVVAAEAAGKQLAQRQHRLGFPHCQVGRRRILHLSCMTADRRRESD